MSAFNAFKANVLVVWSRNLYITPASGMPGARRLHHHTLEALEALRLTKCNRTVMCWDTPIVQEMRQQVFQRIVSLYLLGPRGNRKL